MPYASTFRIAAAAAAFIVVNAELAFSQNAKRLRPRQLPEKSLEAALTPGGDPRVIVLKIIDDARARAVNGKLESAPGGADCNNINDVLARYPGARVERMITVDDVDLNRVRREAERNTGEEMADMSQYFFVRLPEGVDSRALITSLIPLAIVEDAYLAPTPCPPPGDVGIATPSFVSLQYYRNAAPLGIDAIYAKGVAIPGAGVTIADIEYSWNLLHEDLMLLGGASILLGPPPVDPFNDTNHGTAVLG